MKHTLLYGYIVSIVAAFIYAAYIVTNRLFLIQDFNPMMFAFGSGLVASLLSTGLLFNSHGKHHLKQVSRMQWKLISIYGAVSTLRRVLLFWGLALASAANAGFLLAGARPIFALLFGFALMKEVLHGRHILIILGMISGLFLLSTQGTLTFQAGDGLLAACGAVLGGLAALSRKITTTGVSPLALTFFEMTLSTLGLLGVVALTSSFSLAGWEAWILSGGLIFFATLTRNLALARVEAAIFSSLYLLSPVFSAIMGVILLSEQVAPIQWCGGALILAGGYLLIRLGNQAASQKAAPRLDELASTSALLDFYRFRQPPFHVSPDPDVVCLSPSHEKALAAMRYVIEARLGLAAVLGGTGVGKTMLMRTCMARMAQPHVKMIYFPHAQLSFAEMLKQICHALDVEPQPTTVAGLVSDLQGALIDAYNKEQLVALIIDDVHHMPVETMQSLRLLLNLETPKAKLIQIILCGHPEVETTWNLAALEPLRQCLMIRAAIEPLTPAESRAYIQQRINRVTRRLAPVFTERALKRIVRYTAGNPRLINTVCNNALIEGFIYQQNPVADSIVKRAMAGLAGLAPRPGLTHSLFFMLGLLAGTALLAGLLYTPSVQSAALSLLRTLAP